MVIEFLHRVIQTFAQYFEEFSDSSIKENCVIVFEVIFFSSLLHNLKKGDDFHMKRHPFF